MQSNYILHCQHVEHQQKEIIGICMNQMCKNFKPYCSSCIQELHYSHIGDLIEFDKLENNEKLTYQNDQCVDKLKAVQNISTELLSFYKKKISITQNSLKNLTLTQINQVVDDKNKIDSQQQSIFNILQQIFNQLVNIQNILQNKPEQITNLNQNLLKQTNSQNIIKNPIQNNNNQINFTFSNTLKHKNINVGENNQIAISTGLFNQELGIILCEPQIQKNKTTKIIFQITQLSTKVALGIALQNRYKFRNENDYIIKEYSHQGYYMIRNDGHKYQSNLKQYNYNNSFYYQSDQIIIIEVDPIKRKITWRNQNFNLSYEMDFLGEEDIYFAVGFAGVFGQQIIKILSKD